MLPQDFNAYGRPAVPVGKPSNMTDEQCYSIMAIFGTDPDGFPIIETEWKPNKEDMEVLNQGGAIRFRMTGYQLVPHSLRVVDKDHNEI